MKTNVTLKLDADLLREARVVAAEEGRSISALLTDRLEAIVRERKGVRQSPSPRARKTTRRHGSAMDPAQRKTCGAIELAHVLYSEDLSDGQKYGAVRVTNPFREIE